MLKNSFALYALMIICSVVSAQDTPSDSLKQIPSLVGVSGQESDTMKHSSTIILSDELERYVIMMDSVDKTKPNFAGYRIQIYSNSGPGSKEDVIEKQSKFLQVYKRYPSYAMWSSPNWVLRVGDFRSRLEALEFHSEIRTLYPASFIINDDVVSPYKE